ncbi:Protein DETOXIFICATION 33 [Glycine soja]
MRKNEELTAADCKRAAIIETENHKNNEVKTQIETCKGVSKALNEQKLFGPAILTSICQYSFGALTQTFAGLVGDLELAAVSVENSVVAGLAFGVMVLNPPLQQPRDQDQQAWLPAVSPPPLPACAVATTSMHRRRLGSRNSSTSTVIGGGNNNILRFYTDNAPGLKISPTVVLVMSFCFIGFTALHVFGKLYRSKSGGAV